MTTFRGLAYYPQAWIESRVLASNEVALLRKLIALLTVFVLVMPAMASAEVTRQEVSDAEAKASAVSRRLESELGALDAAIIEQSQLEERIAALQREVTSRDREVALARVAAKERARAMYVTAGTQRAPDVGNRR